MEYNTATIVATPNSRSVKLTCRSRTTAWSAARVRPKMLYSPVWASASGAGGVRGPTEPGRERGENDVFRKSESGGESIIPTGVGADGFRPAVPPLRHRKASNCFAFAV